MGRLLSIVIALSWAVVCGCNPSAPWPPTQCAFQTATNATLVFQADHGVQTDSVYVMGASGVCAGKAPVDSGRAFAVPVWGMDTLSIGGLAETERFYVLTKAGDTLNIELREHVAEPDTGLLFITELNGTEPHDRLHYGETVYLGDLPASFDVMFASERSDVAEVRFFVDDRLAEVEKSAPFGLSVPYSWQPTPGDHKLRMDVFTNTGEGLVPIREHWLLLHVERGHEPALTWADTLLYEPDAMYVVQRFTREDARLEARQRAYTYGAY